MRLNMFAFEKLLCKNCGRRFIPDELEYDEDVDEYCCPICNSYLFMPVESKKKINTKQSGERAIRG